MIAAQVSESPTPFHYAAGLGVRIAVIDSGNNPAHPHSCAPIKAVPVGARAGRDFGTGPDTLGHGTAVTAAIQEKAPGAEYFAVKLFRSSLRATTARLLEAIQWAITENIASETRKCE